jgi:membrane-bound ClpP family serine protease
MDRAWRTYLVVSALDWGLLAALLLAAVRWFGLPVWGALALLGAWISKDILLYPSARRFYESQPAERRIVGEEGVTLSPIDPEGFARVHGEVWQVRLVAGGAPLPAGARVRVADVRGLQLVIEPERRPYPGSG